MLYNASSSLPELHTKRKCFSYFLVFHIHILLELTQCLDATVFPFELSQTKILVHKHQGPTPPYVVISRSLKLSFPVYCKYAYLPPSPAIIQSTEISGIAKFVSIVIAFSCDFIWHVIFDSRYLGLLMSQTCSARPCIAGRTSVFCRLDLTLSIAGRESVLCSVSCRIIGCAINWGLRPEDVLCPCIVVQKGSGIAHSELEVDPVL